MPLWPARQLHLECYPPVPEHMSLPWNSADELLLDAGDPPQPTLILNDRHGALCCGLQAGGPERQLRVWTDSFCAREAIRLNSSTNGLPLPEMLSLEQLESVSGVRQVLIQIPKNHDLLAFQLSIIARQCPEATVHLAGMARHLPVALLNRLESLADSYSQSRVIRKARMITLQGLSGFLQPDDQLWQGYSQDDMRINALPGVFCRDRLDPGTRVLLNHLPADIRGKVCDLGCGNGVLALSIKHQHPQTGVLACDDSELAVSSVQHNVQTLDLNLEVLHSNALSETDAHFDWILCNPPFHDGHTQQTEIAETMFRDAARHLTTDGQFLIVANRHLPYLPVLRRLYADVRVISADRRFSVYHCRSPKKARS